MTPQMAMVRGMRSKYTLPSQIAPGSAMAAANMPIFMAGAKGISLARPAMLMNDRGK